MSEWTGSGDSTGLRERASEAFATLGNETRLQILLTLWAEYDPGAETNAMSFSELRERAGMRDSGQFNYHLEKLVGDFVTRTDGGYAIREPGRQVVRAVVASVGVPEPDVEPVGTQKRCLVCEGPTELSYRDQQLFLACTDCEGLYEETAERPAGTLVAYECDRSGLAGRDLLEAYDAVQTRMSQRVTCVVQGVCSECTGPVERSLVVCPDHTADGVCETCGRRFEAVLELSCAVCKYHVVGPPRLFSNHPAVWALYDEHDVPFVFDPDHVTGVTRRLRVDGEFEHDVVSTAPPVVRVTLRHDGGTVWYELDGALNLIEAGTG